MNKLLTDTEPLLSFYSNLLETDEEKSIIKMILDNIPYEQIVENLIEYSNHEEKQDD